MAVGVLGARGRRSPPRGGGERQEGREAIGRRPPRPNPKARARSRRSPACPTRSGASFERPAVTVKINNTTRGKQQAASTRPTSCTKKSSRAASRASRRSSTRRRPTSSARCARCARPTRASCGRSAAIFAYSGGAQYAIDSINTAPVEQLDETPRRATMMFRERLARNAPVQPLRARRPDVRAPTAASPSRRRRCSSYRKAECQGRRRPASALVRRRVPRRLRAHLDVGREGEHVDAHASCRARSVYDADGNPIDIAPKNVVVMFVQYAGGAGVAGPKPCSPAPVPRGCSPTARSCKGTWTRPDKEKPAKLTDATAADPAARRARLGRAARRVVPGDGAAARGGDHDHRRRSAAKIGNRPAEARR